MRSPPPPFCVRISEPMPRPGSACMGVGFLFRLPPCNRPPFFGGCLEASAARTGAPRGSRTTFHTSPRASRLKWRWPNCGRRPREPPGPHPAPRVGDSAGGVAVRRSRLSQPGDRAPPLLRRRSDRTPLNAVGMTGGGRPDGGCLKSQRATEARGASVRGRGPALGTPGAALAGRADEVAVRHAGARALGVAGIPGCSRTPWGASGLTGGIRPDGGRGYGTAEAGGPSASCWGSFCCALDPTGPAEP